MTDASSQLRRLLELIPRCANDRPHRLADIAREIGVDEETVLRDLRRLSERFGDPGGFVEGVQIYVESDHFAIHSDHFLRPIGFTRDELSALDLGLALVRSTRTPEEHTAIDNARDRLHRAMVRLPTDHTISDHHHASLGGGADPKILATVRSGVRRKRRLALTYRGAKDPSARERQVDPYAVVHARGHWFLVGSAEEKEIRIFRIDRIMEIAVTDHPVSLPDNFSLDQVMEQGRVFAGQVDRTLQVRYSARIAPWIREREKGLAQADGSLVVEYALGNVEWAVCHVMQYAAEVEALGPPEVREEITRRLERLIARRRS